MAENEPLVGEERAGGAPAPEAGPSGPAPSGERVDLRGRYTIYPDQPLPHLNSPTAVAFAAQMRSDSNRALMALACNPDLPPRTDTLEALRGYSLSGMLKPVDWGMVDWPGDQRRRFIILLERPGGARAMPSLNGFQAGMGEEELVVGLFQPLLSTLREFSGRMVTHRSIRPDNLFFVDGGRRQMVLGEGFSAPPAHDQPVVFETIESSMAHSTGRGNGSQANDLYSFGVTVLFFILGRNPVGDLDPERLLANKIEFGTYASLIGQQRIPLGLMEPLRGMLTDDPRERWGVTDLDMWLSGRRLSPKQPKLPQRASRPFVFQEIEFFNTRSLAMSFARDYRAAGAVVRSKALDSWLRRSLNDEVRADAVQVAVSANNSGGAAGGRGGEDRLVARAILPLDPAAPIRYRGFGVMVDGIGPALAAAMHDRERRQVMSEIISSRLPVYWVGAQGKPKAEDLRAVQLLDKLPGVIDQAMIGYGVERCLYELNPGERCHSPLFEQDYVVDITRVIPALEAVARSSNRPDMPMDRHIVAFVAARARRVTDEILRGLGAAENETRALSLLRLYTLVQDQSASPPAPVLAQWLAHLLGPVVSSYHLRKRRAKIQNRVQRVAQDGILSDLLAAVDDQSERVADQVGFNDAASEYRGLDYSLRSFHAEKQKRDDEGRILGEQIAVAIGGILVSVTMAISVFLYFA